MHKVDPPFTNFSDALLRGYVDGLTSMTKWCRVQRWLAPMLGLGLLAMLIGITVLSLAGPASLPQTSRLRFVRSQTESRPAASPSSYLNDNYCDTGLDEPLTSACAGHPLSVFVCRQATLSSIFPLVIPSSRVGDGRH